MQSLKFGALGLATLLMIVVISFGIEFYLKTGDLPTTTQKDARITLDPGNRVSFYVVGDSGTGLKDQHKVANAMQIRCKKNKPDGILLLGDVVYPSGVTSAVDSQWQDKVFDVYDRSCLRDIPIYPVYGNHDYEGDIRSWFDIGKEYPRWKFPGRHYSIEYSNLLTIYAIDTKYPLGITNLIPEFGNSSSVWTIAMGHHPVNSDSEAGGGHKGGGLRGWYLKKILCDTVDSYLAGHTHHLEYGEIENCSMDQYISGAGGGALYSIDKDGDSTFAASRFGYLEIEFTKELFASKFISTRAEIIFEHQSTKSID